MRNLLKFLFSFFLILISCSPEVEQQTVATPKFEAEDSIIDYDSINRMDSEGKRQGFWILLDDRIHYFEPNVRYKEMHLGNYSNGKKDGVWEVTTMDGKPLRTILYKDGEIQLSPPNNE